MAGSSAFFFQTLPYLAFESNFKYFLKLDKLYITKSYHIPLFGIFWLLFSLYFQILARTPLCILLLFLSQTNCKVCFFFPIMGKVHKIESQTS